MRKSKHPFSLMSDVECHCGCRRRIKLNVAERIQRRPLLAYPCWKSREFRRRTRAS